MENLKKLIGEELFKQVVDKLDGTKKYMFGLEENYVSKDSFNTLNEKSKGYKEQLDDRDKQLNDLKEANKGNDELQTKLSELEANNAKIKEEYEQKLSKSKLDYAVDLAITKAKTRNPIALKALLNLEQIELKDGKVSGIDEQLKAIKESDGYLFEDDVPSGTGFGKTKDKIEVEEEFTKEQARKIRQGLF